MQTDMLYMHGYRIQKCHAGLTMHQCTLVALSRPLFATNIKALAAQADITPLIVTLSVILTWGRLYHAFACYAAAGTDRAHPAGAG